jgi:hypothetical protein
MFRRAMSVEIPCLPGPLSRSPKGPRLPVTLRIRSGHIRSCREDARVPESLSGWCPIVLVLAEAAAAQAGPPKAYGRPLSVPRSPPLDEWVAHRGARRPRLHPRTGVLTESSSPLAWVSPPLDTVAQRAAGRRVARAATAAYWSSPRISHVTPERPSSTPARACER